ncbi:hypothetical protein WJX81_006155 [Elliptochloris bilobata]|uniref:Protein YIP n=1 Tax=Elliptochloris bilobata TaxID=381761 RepID=A0AAW1R029_9CHLO
MSEYQLSFDQNVHSRPGHQSAMRPSGGSGGPVEWYQAGGTQFAPANYSYPAADGGPASSGAYGSFEDEAPLLEELGIDVQAILRRSLAILTGRLGSAHMADLDMGGPLAYALLLASVHLLTGKLHFGVILGWSVVGSTAVWFVANNIGGGSADTPDGGAPGLYDCCCLLGYCLLPLIVHALVSLLMPKGVATLALAALAVLWAARTAARLFVRRSPALEDHAYLLAYPCLLVFVAFALLNVY